MIFYGSRTNKKTCLLAWNLVYLTYLLGFFVCTTPAPANNFFSKNYPYYLCNDVITWLDHLTQYSTSSEQFNKVMISIQLKPPPSSNLQGLYLISNIRPMLIDKLSEVVLVGKHENFKLRAFQVIFPSLESLNNGQK